MDKSSQILLVVFVAICAFSMVAQAVSAIGLFLGARAAQKKLLALADDVRLHALPVIISSQQVVQDLTPRLKVISENLEKISDMARTKSEKVSGLVDNVTNRAQVQADRVDGMVKGTLDQVTHAVQAIENGVQKPLRQVNGIINGLRAGLDELRKKEEVKSEEGEDLFV
jgi:predicted transcriptional regulator